MDKFLKRDCFDPNTRTWSFSDGSGKILDEARIEMQFAPDPHGNLSDTIKMFGKGGFFDIKERYSVKDESTTNVV